jgi:hypothetical protein
MAIRDGLDERLKGKLGCGSGDRTDRIEIEIEILDAIEP